MMRLARFFPAFVLVSQLAAAQSGLHVIKTYRLGGDGGWDYLKMDSDSRHLFISRATHVIVKTERGARTMAFDHKTHALYLVTANFGPPPAATAGNPRPRPAILPDTFKVLVVGK